MNHQFKFHVLCTTNMATSRRFSHPPLGQPPPPRGLSSSTQQSREPSKKFNPEKMRELATHVLRARVLWGFMGPRRMHVGDREWEWHRRIRQHPTILNAPGAAASTGTFCAGAHSRALPMGYLHPERGRGGASGLPRPLFSGARLSSRPSRDWGGGGDFHLPLISCMGASFLLKPLDM